MSRRNRKRGGRLNEPRQREQERVFHGAQREQHEQRERQHEQDMREGRRHESSPYDRRTPEGYGVGGPDAAEAYDREGYGTGQTWGWGDWGWAQTSHMRPGDEQEREFYRRRDAERDRDWHESAQGRDPNFERYDAAADPMRGWQDRDPDDVPTYYDEEGGWRTQDRDAPEVPDYNEREREWRERGGHGRPTPEELRDRDRGRVMQGNEPGESRDYGWEREHRRHYGEPAGGSDFGGERWREGEAVWRGPLGSESWFPGGSYGETSGPAVGQGRQSANWGRDPEWTYPQVGRSTGQEGWGRTRTPQERHRRRRDRQEQEYRNPGPKGYTRGDERIKEDVSDRLMQNPHIDAGGIEVDVVQGDVTLKGQVPERRLKYLAEDLALAVLGVKDVRNELRVERTIQR